MMTPRLRTFCTVLMAVLLVVLTGCKTASSSSGGSQAPTPTPIPPPPVPDKPTYTVKLGEVVDNLSFTGRVSPVVEEELYFRTDGRVKTVYVERDDVVEKDQLLAELENDDLVRQLAQAQIELETAEANLKDAQNAQTTDAEKARINQEIKQLQLEKLESSYKSLQLDAEIAASDLAEFKAGPTADDLEIARRNLEKAQNSLWAVQISRDATCGRTSEADCNAAQANVQRSEADLRIAEISYEEIKRGPSADEIAVEEARYEQIQEKLAQMRLDIEIQRQSIALGKIDLDTLEASIDPSLTKSVERAKLSVERLEAQVGDTQILSPIAGKVTSVSAYAGRELAAYRQAFVVADESEFEVTAEPLSTQLQRLTEGMDAAIILSDYPGKELPAKIVQLPYPYGTGGSAIASTVDEPDKITHISVDFQDLALESGDLVKVIVVLERKSDVLWLPPAAIRTFSGRRFVVVDEDGRQRRVDVTVGIESAERVEITEGLTEGMIVVGQ